MYKLTFPDQTTASLIKLNDQFVLVQPELSQEAHAALCLFLPNEEKADNERQLGRTKPILIEPQAFCDYRRGDEVMYEIGSHKALGVVTRTAHDSVNLRVYAGLEVLVTRPELITPTGERIENLYVEGARVVFQAGQLTGELGVIKHPTSAASYKVLTPRDIEGDYPAAHLKLESEEVILPLTKDASNQLGVQVKLQTTFALGDTVLIRTPDNSVTLSTVLDAKCNMVKCTWPRTEHAYFSREQLTKVKPEQERLKELGMLKQGDKLLVVVGKNVTGNARRGGSLSLGDIVTFDRWVSSEDDMKVMIVESTNLYPAELFQQTE